MTLSEIEDRAKQIIRSACPAELMEVECLTTDRETGRVFVVLRCLTPMVVYDPLPNSKTSKPNALPSIEPSAAAMAKFSDSKNII